MEQFIKAFKNENLFIIPYFIYVWYKEGKLNNDQIPK